MAEAKSSQKLIKKVRVKNALGLHTRPATAIVKLLQHAKSEVLFTCRKETINAKSILSILMLAARKNTMITIVAEGSDAHEVMSSLVHGFESKFGEER